MTLDWGGSVAFWEFSITFPPTSNCGWPAVGALTNSHKHTLSVAFCVNNQYDLFLPENLVHPQLNMMAIFSHYLNLRCELFTGKARSTGK